MTNQKPDNRPVTQVEYQPGTQCTQDTGVMGSDPNAMELDWLSADEYCKQRAGSLCFKCRKKGLACDFPCHNEINEPTSN